MNYPNTLYDTVHLKVPPVNITTKTTGNSTTESVSYNGLFQTLTDLLTGPLLIPSFGTFLQAQFFLSNVAAKGNSDLLLQTSAGQSYGNLLRVGTMHFAPRSALTMDLMAYLNNTAPLFKNLSVYIHDTEGDALKSIQNQNRKQILALIVLNDISNQSVDYAIR